ncbi:MAG: AAA family ATPase [Acidimicrobiia bacterium]|nr:AAA family ATPase [Acidimicrobiia bacterium]
MGDRVYKLKKPVDLGFLDFTTREARERICHREVELNRRLAPDVYLGVLDVVSDGEPCDHLVVMRRMPADRRLSTLVVDGDPRGAEWIHGLARLLADFHARAERSPVIDRSASADAVRRNWDDNLAAMVPFEGAGLDEDLSRRVATLVHRYLDGRGPLFEQRIATGQVCDGHGDLQAADIFCLEDGPRVLDCIEFSDELRHGDVMADLGFLAMDLERLGAPELADQLVEEYDEFAAEVCPSSLLHHYVAYRAHVRCKVNCLRSSQMESTARDEVLRAASDLLELAAAHLERARVRLVLVGGLPGTGKTTVAEGLAERSGWTVLRSDVIRKELAGLPPDAPADAAYGEGIYGPETTDRVYQELRDRARVALGLGESVILDASWSNEGERVRARELAEACVADVAELVCRVPAETAAARIRERRARGRDASDATTEVAERMAATADDWPEAAVVDTGATPDEAVDAAWEELRGEPEV